MKLVLWQTMYVLTAAALLPFSPLLYLQGMYTRRKVGLLPGAGGETTGTSGDYSEHVRLLVIGESTVAGLGARTHELGLAGQFAMRLSNFIGKSVDWTVIGKNGVTARRTVNELLPLVPDEKFDYILVGIGGNDVIKLSSPRKWRHGMEDLLESLRLKNPDAVVFITNCPMINMSPAIPQPIKFFLWKLSRLHDVNIKDLTTDMHRVFYYHQPHTLRIEGFFADGVHPSERGYSDWAEAMIVFFSERYKW